MGGPSWGLGKQLMLPDLFTDDCRPIGNLMNQTEP